MREIKINKSAAAFLPLTVAVFNVFILLFPREMTEAAKTGVSLWFNNVLPALTPFVIGANLLMALGAVHFLSVLLNPIMKPLFGVPGSGGFAFAVGLMSGSPVGAKVTCELRENGNITAAEGQRLLSFTNNCGPLFILGAVAAFMLDNVAVGYFIITAHIISAILIGLVFKNYGSKQDKTSKRSAASKRNRGYNILSQAFQAMIHARRQDNRSFGQILGTSVLKAMETLLLIGGFIIVFNVLSTALQLIGVFSTLSGLFSQIINLPDGLFEGIMMGFLEMASGSNAISTAYSGRVVHIALLGVISWGGLSVHAQAASYISKTDLSVSVYLFSKLLHTIFAIIVGIILYPIFSSAIERAAPIAAGAFPSSTIGMFARSSLLLGYTLVGVLVLVILIAIFHAFRAKK